MLRQRRQAAHAYLAAACVCLVGMGRDATAAQPADGWLAAWQDIQTISPSEAKYTRYLWLLEQEPKLQAITYLTVAAHANALSSNSLVVPPIAVLTDGTLRRFPAIGPADWGKIAVIRLNTLDYGDYWYKVFDRLGDPRLEPFFHVNTLVYFDAGYYGKDYYAAGDYQTTAIAPWVLSPLGAKASDDQKRKAAVFGLIKATDYSPSPIVEATNFVWQSSIQFDRQAGYYDFLGVKNRKDFQRLVGFDPKASFAFAYPQLEATAESEIAQQARRFEIWQKIGGRYIFTRDQVNQRGVGVRNPLETTGLNDYKADAQEVFAALPNGFWATGLFADADGTRQDSAPDGVGYNHFAAANDGKIHVYLTCLGCHDKRPGNGGLHPIRSPYFRKLYAAPGPVALADPDPFVLKVQSQFYLTRIDFDPDRRAYIEALNAACGLLPHQYAAYLGETFHRWDRPVDMDRAALELGTTKEEMLKSLGASMNVFGTLGSNSVANWIKHPAQQSRIGRDQWVEVVNVAQLGIRGLPTKGWPRELRQAWPVRK